MRNHVPAAELQRRGIKDARGRRDDVGKFNARVRDSSEKLFDGFRRGDGEDDRQIAVQRVERVDPAERFSLMIPRSRGKTVVEETDEVPRRRDFIDFSEQA